MDLLLTLVVLLIGAGAAAITYKICSVVFPWIGSTIAEIREQMRANRLGSWHFRPNNEINWR